MVAFVGCCLPQSAQNQEFCVPQLSVLRGGDLGGKVGTVPLKI